MKAFFIYIFSLSLALILLPAMLAGGWWNQETGPGQTPAEPEQFTTDGEDFVLNIYLSDRNEIGEIKLEEYIRGVVAAEMPASFHLEALKAQAVVVRTYTLHKSLLLGGTGCRKHPGVDLCTDSTCCQAWVDDQLALLKWKDEEADFYLERITEAVSSTQGLILTYHGIPITSVYHSTCGGLTEGAAEVWSGGGAPYLQIVECHFCQHSPYYKKELSMDLRAYAAAFQNEKEAQPVLAEGNTPLMNVIRKSQSGRNLLVSVGKPGQQYSGTEVRGILGLPSTFFQWRVQGDQVIFNTRGYGHGVGLCQYGADGMGKEGNSFTEILQHYYRGVEVEDSVLFRYSEFSSQSSEAPENLLSTVY
ncbi:MAG: stage II sporulation protein D [Bacillota bacterium]|nr:stage II sporulation protein D [Bacillota bacterium]